MTHTVTFAIDSTVPQSNPETQRRHPDLCFEDATVAISTGSTFFLVHHGLLSRHSAFFSSLDISSTKEPKDLLDGRPAVTLSDISDDMFYFLRAIYDGLSSLSCSAEDFHVVSAILRLATKYKAVTMRESLLEKLYESWPSSLTKWDLRERQATDASGLYSPRPMFPHPILVIKLAREVDAPLLLPSAFYDLSRYLPSQMVSGYTANDMLTHKLSHGDVVTTLKGKESASRFFSTFIVKTLEGREASKWCLNNNSEALLEKRRTCRISFEGVTFELLRDINGFVCNRNSDQLYAMAEAIGMQTRDFFPNYEKQPVFRACENCRQELSTSVNSAREEFWARLPDWFKVQTTHWNIA